MEDFSPVTLVTDHQRKRRQFELIRFDKKVNVYVGVCLLLYLLFVVCKWHNSSIALWNLEINDGGSERRGLVAGHPLSIRSDEWLVESSFVLAQEKNDFPLSNEALGYGNTPLMMGLPVKHFLSIIKPALWGYYILDYERAFSWQWNFKIFPFLISSFLFLMLFTKNNFLVSVFGSTWLFLSSAIQWWSIYTEMFTFTFLIIISFIYMLYSVRARLILVNGLIFIIAAYSFATLLYPAYQVPISYFSLSLIIGYVASQKNFKVLLSEKFLKIAVLLGSVTVLIILGYLFYVKCGDTIKLVANTVYPGKRNETGGGVNFISMFKDNFSWFVHENHVPPKWGNICELSSFLMLSPIVAVRMIYNYVKTKKFDALLISLLVFQFFIYIWQIKGFPEFLSRLTLLKTSPPHRTFFVFGFSNVVFTLLYLGQTKDAHYSASPERSRALIFIVIFCVVFGINFLLNRQADRFFSIVQIFNAAILFSILNWLVVYFKEGKVFQYLFLAGCFFFVASNLFVNPFSKGLSPYLDNKVYESVSAIKKKDPDAGWVVFGHLTAPDFIKAAGVNCFNGVKYAPLLEKLHTLDPNLESENVYNRYAHIMFFPLIQGKDSIKFTLNQADLYSIQMDPCSPKLNQIGIKYFMFAYKPSDAEVRCMVPVKDAFGFFIYKRRDL